ncbi:UDP-N-acetylmuramoyl-L-alanine--D-glutamate ligase [Alkalicoccus halolimnae]|uniref:UDP-N-acetylmuramoylalanine--D-glutamate ligase n=1 Tax=Alkalicoccus halolimnae TaxID=1667239 RepID=A0A5C7FD73_9BACI|nr:UDP-N-acetylmuramoyl-L-alanine--D-glutamate ligase [Alkalicoccus halolimnae]TXF87430.1 UDP-N-acetylmuramoyl-L-alanine--D-glutamate ligase [Alkalicoccus halolimnae]
MQTTRWLNKNVLVLGLARSGTEAAKLLLELGAKVTVNDQTPFAGNKQAQELKELGAEVICGSHPLDLIHNGLDTVVKNPGIRYDHPMISKAAELAIPILTEIQLAYDSSPCPITAVTGSNGKTTTTTMIGEMLRASGLSPLTAGNIGEAASGVVRNAQADNNLVMELSSFQLMGIDSFRPKTAVLLNLVDAHLDYHGTREEYIRAKKQIFRYQTEDDYLIYNADDPTVVDMVEDASAQKIPFSLKSEQKSGAYIKEGMIFIMGEPASSLEAFSLPGEYNIANAMAAGCAAKTAGADIKSIGSVMKSFSGVKHRLQFVKEWKGRSFYNNSKATNVPAAITSLEAFEKPVILLCGGLDRGLPFNELTNSLHNVKAMLTYGETAGKLAEAGRAARVNEIHELESLEEAVLQAVKLSAEGDIVLLSPACASWDQFKTFEERGETFIEAVNEYTSDHKANHGGR